MVDVLYQPPLGTCTPPEDSLSEMDAAGVAVAMVSQCRRWSCERQTLCVDTRLEDVARFMQASVRFAGLAGYNPFDAVESLREMDAARALGFRGTYFHAASFGLRLTDARVYPLFAKSAEIGLPCVVEVPLAEPDLARSTRQIGSDFPELSLALVYPRPDEAMLAVLEVFERLAYVVDTAALRWMLTRPKHSGLDDPRIVERCMWGSNAGGLAQTTADVMALDLPLETLETIVRTNALRYFAPPPVMRGPQSLPGTVTAAER